MKRNTSFNTSARFAPQLASLTFIKTLLVHPVTDSVGVRPAVSVDFVTSEVHQGFREEACLGFSSGQVLEESLYEVEGCVSGRIERLCAGGGRADFRVPLTPRRCMSGCINLDHNADATLAGVLDKVGDVVGGVALFLAVGAHLAEEGVGVGVEREGLAVDEVPVEDVELSVGEGVDDVLCLCCVVCICGCVSERSEDGVDE